MRKKEKGLIHSEGEISMANFRSSSLREVRPSMLSTNNNRQTNKQGDKSPETENREEGGEREREWERDSLICVSLPPFFPPLYVSACRTTTSSPFTTYSTALPTVCCTVYTVRSMHGPSYTALRTVLQYISEVWNIYTVHSGSSKKAFFFMQWASVCTHGSGCREERTEEKRKKERSLFFFPFCCFYGLATLLCAPIGRERGGEGPLTRRQWKCCLKMGYLRTTVRVQCVVL